MASKAVTAAVLARIQANWTRLPVVDPNGAPNPPVGGFLDIEYPISDENQITIGAPGSNVFRESGAIRLIMSIPVGGGLSPFDGYFEELRALFRGQTFEGVVCWAASPAATDDRNDQGSFYKLTCAIPYQFDLIA